MPKDEEKQASENSNGRMPAADAQQRMIEWAESILNNFTPADAMTYDKFENLPQVQPYIARQYTVTEPHDCVDITDEVKKKATIGENAKIMLDLVTNNEVFGELAEGGEGYVNTAPRGMPATNVYVAISFEEFADDIPAVQKLTAFDENVLENTFSIIIENMHNEGTLPAITVSQICSAMTNGKTRGGRLYEQVKASVEKMSVTRIVIDNTEEIEEGMDYKHFSKNKKGRYLLPFEWDVNTYKGREEMEIHFLRIPALLLFAADRNQIATITREAATCTGKHTPMRMAVYRYILRLLLLHSGPDAIKFDTIYEHCGITDEREKYRMQNDYLKEFFVHYKKCGLVENYSIKKQQKKVTFTRANLGVKKLENKC